MIAAMARRISSPIIVGRTEELDALLAAAERGAAGDTETVVVRGEAGIGKSRLVLELGIEAASRGFDLVVETTGNAGVMAETLGLLRRSGVACLLGIDPHADRVELDAKTLAVDAVLENRVLFGSVNA